MRPTKQWGQNFVVDANTVRKIVRRRRRRARRRRRRGRTRAWVAHPRAAARSSRTSRPSRSTRGSPGPRGDRRGAPAGERRPAAPRRGRRADLTTLPGPDPTALVANLPYNISVPVVLSFLQHFPTIERVLVMVQLEVAERLAAEPGQQDLRRAQPQGRLVRRRRLAGHGAAAASSGRRPTSTPDSSRCVRRKPPPDDGDPRGGLPLHRRRLRASVASRCAPRSRDGPAVLRRAEAAAPSPPASTRATRGEQLDIAAFARDRRREAARDGGELDASAIG